MNIQEINNELLERLLQLREVNPSFTFWLRRGKLPQKLKRFEIESVKQK